ncbi:carbohydrate-binding protein CenC [Pseudomonas sp. NPDC089530]|uniref:carbohydrate-binding protein CenC n=1 Tax=Pseudomonas sp. NPDC089530 TaxID=3390651 RepID=UPI003CFEDDB4
MDYPKSVPSAGLVSGQFVDENPIAGTPGSLIPASWGNAVTQEITNAIGAAGISPVEGQNNQLTLAIKELAKLDPLQAFPVQVYRKNHVINGNFDIWQRGTVNQGTNIGGYVADRFRCDWNGNAGVNISRQNFTLGQTAVPNEPRFFLRWQQVSAGAGANTHRISQNIESVRTLAGKLATVTFWAKADTERTVTVTMTQSFGGGSESVVTSAGAFKLSSAWSRYTATLNIPSIAGKTLGGAANDCLRLAFDLPLNVLQTIDLAQIQVEEGAVSTPFEFRTPAEELMLCQRYYEKTLGQDIQPGDTSSSIAGALVSIVKQGQSGSSSQPLAQWSFKVEKRTTPSITLYRVLQTGTVGQWRSGSDAISSANARPYSVSARGTSVDNSDVAVAPQTYYIHATADAEI